MRTVRCSGHLGLGVSAGGVWVRGCLPRHPPVNRMTDRCKIITFTQSTRNKINSITRELNATMLPSSHLYNWSIIPKPTLRLFVEFLEFLKLLEIKRLWLSVNIRQAKALFTHNEIQSDTFTLKNDPLFSLSSCQWIMGRIGDRPILPIIQPITIDTMLNWITGRFFKVKVSGWISLYVNAP